MGTPCWGLWPAAQRCPPSLPGPPPAPARGGAPAPGPAGDPGPEEGRGAAGAAGGEGGPEEAAEGSPPDQRSAGTCALPPPRVAQAAPRDALQAPGAADRGEGQRGPDRLWGVQEGVPAWASWAVPLQSACPASRPLLSTLRCGALPRSPCGPRAGMKCPPAPLQGPLWGGKAPPPPMLFCRWLPCPPKQHPLGALPGCGNSGQAEAAPRALQGGPQKRR